MTIVFHALSDTRFIEIKSNLRRENQDYYFIGAVSVIQIMQQSQSKLEEAVNPSILKDEFSSRKDPFIFTSIAPVLLDRSNETS